ncbi:MAG: chemotaxis protein CheA [Gammaproteobacteria bacterium]|nr:chemotaxis protein CheA [Gammaproteobacteria bacterium]
MTIDMQQFHQTFFEESFEGLNDMERELLNFEAGNGDSDAINTIFRAAHSIKGGSATFGFSEVAEFTHRMETLLDEIRDGKRDMTSQAANLLLKSVDELRAMLTAMSDHEDIDTAEVLHLQQQFDLLLQGDEPSQAGDKGVDVSADVEQESAAGTGWKITFSPHPHMLGTGNEPLRMFRELGSLGELTVSVDHSKLPSFDELIAEECYLAWTLSVVGDIPLVSVEDVFDWVTDDCDLTITALSDDSVVREDGHEETHDSTTDEKLALVGNPAEEKRSGGERRSPLERRKPSSAEASSIRVSTEKIDELVNMVGELVITQSMLNQMNEEERAEGDDEKFKDGLAQLARNTRELQESVMRIRMLPISFTFNRFPRMVHDLSIKLNKKIELKTSGEQTELDKTVMEKIGDPLVHLVRNSLDHGIELPEVRLKAGKPETGVVHINAYHKGGNIIIEITDDGAGLRKDKILKKAIEQGLVGKDEVMSEEKIHDLIFHPGFSTADVVSDVSGRGVGMDVVRRNIKDLGGAIEVTSKEGVGSTFSIRLPLTLAILDGQLVRVGSETYIIPLISIVESLQARPEALSSVAGRAEVYKLRDEYLSIVRLHEIFGLEPKHTNLCDGLLVVVEGEGRNVGLFVDDLLGQQQVVIKSLETNYKRVEGVSGATILGDGTVALILDVSGLIDFSRHGSMSAVA